MVLGDLFFKKVEKSGGVGGIRRRVVCSVLVEFGILDSV